MERCAGRTPWNPSEASSSSTGFTGELRTNRRPLRASTQFKAPWPGRETHQLRPEEGVREPTRFYAVSDTESKHTQFISAAEAYRAVELQSSSTPSPAGRHLPPRRLSPTPPDPRGSLVDPEALP